jgi:hypothetical protein
VFVLFGMISFAHNNIIWSVPNLKTLRVLGFEIENALVIPTSLLKRLPSANEWHKYNDHTTKMAIKFPDGTFVKSPMSHYSYLSVNGTLRSIASRKSMECLGAFILSYCSD